MKKILFTDSELLSGEEYNVPYYQLPKAIIKNSNLTLAQKFVYMELLDKVKQSKAFGKRINSKGQPYAEVSFIFLAESLGMSDRTVKDAIKVLIEEQLVVCSHGNYNKAKKKNDCNRYYVFLPVGLVEEVDEIQSVIDDEIPDEI